MSNIVIRVENLSKEYRLGDIGHGSLHKDLQSWGARLRGKEDPNTKIGSVNNGQNDKNETFWALKDVSFDVQQGEVLGIIGRNGAGKSTLLKILSRVTAPTTGTIKIKGRIASLLEVGTGFHPELSGRDNIYLNGSILGMNKREIDAKFDEIVKFAEVEKFIDTPVKRYSSGMYVRLAFAVAAHLEPEILIIDEVLAVGDVAFQKKCLGKMSEVAKGGRTVLFVSHNMGAVQNLCKRCILLKEGNLSKVGGTLDIINYYLDSNEKKFDKKIFNKDATNKKLFFTDIELYSAEGNIEHIFKCGENILIKINYKVNIEMVNVQLVLELFDQQGICILSSTNFDLNLERREINQKPGKYIAKCLLKSDFLRDGIYYITLSSSIPNIEILDIIEYAIRFEIETPFNITNLLCQDRRGIIFKKLKWLSELEIE